MGSCCSKFEKDDTHESSIASKQPTTATATVTAPSNLSPPTFSGSGRLFHSAAGSGTVAGGTAPAAGAGAGAVVSSSPTTSLPSVTDETPVGSQYTSPRGSRRRITASIKSNHSAGNGSGRGGGERTAAEPDSSSYKTSSTPALNGTEGRRSATPHSMKSPGQSSSDLTAGRPAKDEIKILLLGSGESGKSTILKQMKIIHLGGYSQAEKVGYKNIIYKNLLDCAQGVVDALEKIGVKFTDDDDMLLYGPDHTSGGHAAANSLEYSSSDGQTGNDESDMGSPQINGNGSTNLPGSHRDSISSKTSSQNRFTPVGPSPIKTSVNTGHTLSDTGGPTASPVTSNNPWPVSKSDFEYIRNATISDDPDFTFDAELAVAIENLWYHPVVRTLLNEGRSDLYIMDSAPYFFANVRRISHPEYVPSVNDILRARIKTTGTQPVRFNMGGFNVNMIDVGGQRSERKKWIKYFENVTVVIFCVALSEYDQVLLEENKQNRMMESLVLFESIVNSPWFADTSVVLFLNKIDVFTEKLPYSPLERIFPDYTGGNDVNKAVKYILWRFTQINTRGLKLYPHLTQATDTSNIRLVFAAIKETVLQNALRESGIV